MVTHENGGGHGHHQPPSGFIRKYVFSIDHKVIGIQYLLPGLVLRVRRHGTFAADALAPGMAHREVCILSRAAR